MAAGGRTHYCNARTHARTRMDGRTISVFMARIPSRARAGGWVGALSAAAARPPDRVRVLFLVFDRSRPDRWKWPHSGGMDRFKDFTHRIASHRIASNRIASDRSHLWGLFSCVFRVVCDVVIQSKRVISYPGPRDRNLCRAFRRDGTSTIVRVWGLSIHDIHPS